MRQSPPDKLTKEIGLKIRTDRKRLRLTQEELAAKASCAVITISKIEQGLNLPSLYLFLRLAEALQTDPDALEPERKVVERYQRFVIHRRCRDDRGSTWPRLIPPVGSICAMELAIQAICAMENGR